MATKMSKTWWGKKFIEALEWQMDTGRLQRGRSYAGDRIDEWEIKENKITARVRGNKNPYFGVRKTPYYKTRITFATLSGKAWKGVLQRLSRNAGWVTHLMLNEMPDDIEEGFSKQSTGLLPGKNESDFEADCSCPDYANPCKHIAGMYYRLATLLDQEPLLLFQLRGLSLEKLRHELEQSPLGQALLSQMGEAAEVTVTPVSTFFIQPKKGGTLADFSPETFWSGQALPKKLLTLAVSGEERAVLLLKKQGDYPTFWDKPSSFLEVMDELYHHIARKT
ncbi:MAG: hypothetical protein CL911_06745 [Deltaproteobacteria bacterium]|nr:hypothetical protein [Deltaproteobacteria bacterium]